ncbi:hypothetical protein B5X24_HaOG204560 [Helicoverpa armigera]|nr:hypothetical protein B5X24_HaOG204560 [Helicoverpa armigera]
MWKILILSVTLSVVYGASVNDMYGNYTIVMTFPVTRVPSVCLTFEFSPEEPNVECTCTDGYNSTLVQTRLLERIDSNGQIEHALPKFSTPMVVIDKLSENGPKINTVCDCGGKIYKDRGLFRVVNENFLLTYSLSTKSDEKNILMASELPTNEELVDLIKEIDETKDQDGVKWCTKEIYANYHSKA